MSLVTPDLKQEQDGLSSLVDAVGRWVGGRAGGRSPGLGGAGVPWGLAEGPSPRAGELFFLSSKQPRKQDNYQVRNEFLRKEPPRTRDTTLPGNVFTGTVFTRG